MRPLYHPNVEEITVQGIMHALSDPVRVSIVMELSSADCTRNCSAFLNVQDTPLPKSTLSKHFAVLREAGLIRSERKGVEVHNQVRTQEVMAKFGPLIDAILDAYQKEGQASTALPSGTENNAKPF
jgi:DNA-binding transcriptional ArsR family regulator